MSDLRLALRALRATPIVTLVAVLSLALGIGANTAIFSIVNSLLLRALPVVEPERLAIITGGGSPAQSYPYATWEEIRNRSGAFEGVCAWWTTQFNIAQGGEMRMVDGIYASGEFFNTLRVPALLGRTFTAADDVRGGGRDGAVAVISYAFWQGHFGGAASVLGTSVIVEHVPFAIVGVTPPGFFGAEVGRAFDVALPITADARIRGRETFLDQFIWRLTVMVRLKPGQRLDEATAALRGMQPQIRAAAIGHVFPRSRTEFLKDPLTLVPAASGTSALRQRYERPLLILFAVVALVLFIACANIANVLMARATARRHETSVRVALGASQWRLVRERLIEALLLSTAGTSVGLLFAVWGSRVLVRQFSTQVARAVLDVPLDWRVLAFTSVVTVTTAVLFGVGPAVYATHVAPIDALNDRSSRAEHESRVRLWGALVVAQVALSLLIVVTTGLFMRTFVSLTRLPLGFDANRILVMTVDVSRARIAPGDRVALYLQLTQAVARVPGVAYASASLLTPVSGFESNRFVEVSGAPELPDKERIVPVNFVTPRWFDLYGTPLRSGRDIDTRDGPNAPPVAVVNEAFVRRFFPDRDPLGATVASAAGGRRDLTRPKLIVGVVADAVYRSLREPVRPTMYLSLMQWDFPTPIGGSSISVRSASGSPVLLARSIGTALTSVNRDVAFDVRTMTEQVSGSLSQERLLAVVSGLFGVLVLLLAGLGLYGTASYAVNRRRTEIGIRLALGAAPARVVRLVLSRVSMLVGVGVLVGSAASLWASKFVATLLYGLEPRDPVTLIGAAITLAVVGAAAGLVPARRASRIDPAQVLRHG
jgi:putative ABC transport system permease protein